MAPTIPQPIPEGEERVAFPMQGAPAWDEDAARIAIEQFSDGVHVLMARAHDEESLVEAFDSFLADGMPGVIDVVKAMSNMPLDELMRAIETARGQLSRLDPEVRGLIFEALGVQEQLQPIIARLAREIPASALHAIDQKRKRAPLAYLSEFPVVVAELMLASERGLLASTAVAAFMESSPAWWPAALMPVTARLWRDGARATARLLASAAPTQVPEGLVPAVERLDVAGLAAARSAEDAWLASLVAEHPEQTHIAIHHDAP